MNPGILNRVIEIQEDQSQGETNENGYAVSSWVTVKRIWASVEAVSGTEKVSAGGLIAKASLKFRIRYRPEITVQHRVVYGGKPMNIIFVDDERGAHKYQILYCEAQDDGS